MNILFICTGNTCRSPMAEGLLKAMLEERGLWQSQSGTFLNKDDPQRKRSVAAPISVSSAGIAASTGSPASAHAVKVMKDTGIDIGSHRSQQLNEELAEAADLILTMTEGHKLAVQSWNPSVWQKLHTLKEFAGYGDKDIQDPFGQPEREYMQTRNEIKAALLKIIDKL